MDLSKLSDEQLGVALKVIESAKKHGVNPDFVLPMVRVESDFNPNAKSSAGAIGPMQLMPGTARELGVNPENLDENIDGGMRYLRSLIDNKKLQNNPTYIFSAYNAGPNAKFFETGDIKDLPDETIKHVVRVMGHYGETPPPMTMEAAEAPAEPVEETTTEDTTTTTPARDTSALEAGVATGLAGAGFGAVKVPVINLAQRVGLLPGGRPITPSDAAALAERVMGAGEDVAEAARKTHGGEKWQKALTGISTPGAQMDKTSLDLAKRMNQAVTGGSPGFTGGTITPGGIILNPQDASAVQARQAAAAVDAAQREAQIQRTIQSTQGKDIVQRGANAVISSAPVRFGLAGFGAGFNAQDAYKKFQEGDDLGGYLSSGAAGASGLSVIPKLARFMGPAAVGLTTASQVAGDIRRGDRQSAAESGLAGLTALLPRLFGPLGSAVYSSGLNQGEEEELARRRKMAPTITQ